MKLVLVLEIVFFCIFSLVNYFSLVNCVGTFEFIRVMYHNTVGRSVCYCLLHHIDDVDCTRYYFILLNVDLDNIRIFPDITIFRN